MQFKPIAAIVVLSLVVASLLVSGCTTSNTSTATPTATPTAQGAKATVTATPSGLSIEKLTGVIDDLYKSKNYTVNTPFTVTKSGDTITYHGIITDGPKVLTPYKRDITIVLTPTRTSARTIYQTAIDKQKAQGYIEYITSNSSLVYWQGLLGTTTRSNPSTPKVSVDLHEPYSSFLLLPGSNSLSEYLYGVANTKDYFEVTTVQETLAA
jgi:hypothetical protein